MQALNEIALLDEYMIGIKLFQKIAEANGWWSMRRMSTTEHNYASTIRPKYPSIARFGLFFFFYFWALIEIKYSKIF